MNIKTIIVCASALVFSLCGCDNGSATGSAGGVATGPRAVDGALVSAGLEKASFDKVLGADKDAFYAELKENLPGDFKTALTKAGLDDIEVKWGGVSIVDVEFGEDGAPKQVVPEMVFALSFDHDFDKVAAALKEAASEGNPKAKDATFLGEKGLVLFDDELTVAIASISGKIFVASTSEAGAEKAVALYRDGKGGNALPMDANSVFKAVVNSIGARIVKKMPAEQFEGALGEGVDAAAIFQGLKDVNASVAATDDNGVAVSAKIEAASSDDAAKVVAFLNEQLAGLKAMMTMMPSDDPDSKAAVDALNAMTITAEGATIAAKLTLTGATVKNAIENMK